MTQSVGGWTQWAQWSGCSGCEGTHESTANCVVDGGTGCFEGATRYRSKSCGGDCPGTKKKWRQNIPFERHKFLSNNLSAKEHSRRLIERENIKVEKTKECNMS